MLSPLHARRTRGEEVAAISRTMPVASSRASVQHVAPRSLPRGQLKLTSPLPSARGFAALTVPARFVQ
eukprot:8710784-Pyramimonas_sp.AAC.1